MAEQFWLGPTYEFRCGEWSLLAGVPVEEGRLEWVLSRREEDAETLSQSFVLEPHATREALELILGDVPSEVRTALVDQAAAQDNPRLLSTSETADDGLA